MHDTIPAPLLALAREAANHVTQISDPATFGGIALYDPHKDDKIKSLPSFAAARRAISEQPFVTERYGTETDVGDRLALQFVYQLFPRPSATGIAADARILWRRFQAELKRPDWAIFGVANLRNTAIQPDLTHLVTMGGGVTIRPRSSEGLHRVGLSGSVVDAIMTDVRMAPWGFSPLVMIVEERRLKTPDNLVLTGGATVQIARRAVTCLRLAGQGDITLGTMFYDRRSQFNVGIGGLGSTGPGTPVTPGRAEYGLTRANVQAARRLQPLLALLETNGYAAGPGGLDLAIRFFDSTYDRYPQRADSCLLDTITALEALVGSVTEATFKLAFRVAGLLGRTDKERVEIFQQMKGFYDARSKVVHGAQVKARQTGFLERVEVAREYLRRLLVASVRLATSPAPADTSRFFEDGGGLDDALQSAKERARLRSTLGL